MPGAAVLANDGTEARRALRRTWRRLDREGLDDAGAAALMAEALACRR